MVPLQEWILLPQWEAGAEEETKPLTPHMGVVAAATTRLWVQGSQAKGTAAMQEAASVPTAAVAARGRLRLAATEEQARQTRLADLQSLALEVEVASAAHWLALEAQAAEETVLYLEPLATGPLTAVAAAAERGLAEPRDRAVPAS